MSKPFTTRENMNNYTLGINSSNDAWQPPIGEPVKSMQNLADDLPVVKDNVEYTRSDVSVPSPWANLLFFDALLKDAKNEFGKLSAQARTDWKALLSIVALKDIIGYEVKFERVCLTTDGRNFEDKTFFKNLLDLKPRNHIFDDDGCWNYIDLIMVQNCPIGILSNTYIVCSAYQSNLADQEHRTAASYLKSANLITEDFTFVNPVNMISRDMSLVVYMIGWLNNLKGNISGNADNQGLRNGLAELIKDFINELKNCLSNEDYTECNRLTEDEKLFTFCKYENTPQNVYDLVMQNKLCRVNLATIAERITDKRGNTILDNFGAKLASINSLPNVEIDAEGLSQTITNDSLFLDKLSFVECTYGGKSPFEKFDRVGVIEVGDGLEKKKYSVILPLTEEIFANYKPHEIKDMCSIIGNYDEGFTVSLNFVINGETSTRSRRYLPQDYNVLPEGDIPFIAIWPYAEIKKNGNPAWRDFYTFKMIDTRHMDCKVEIKYENQTVAPLVSVYTNKKDVMQREVLHTEKLPTYIKVSKKNNKDTMDDCGIIILDKPTICSTINENEMRYVGLDFGTTATVAYCSEAIGSDREKFIKLGQLVEFKQMTDLDVRISHNKVFTDFLEGTYIGNNNNACCVVCCDQEDLREPGYSFVPTEYLKHRSYPSVFKVNSKEKDFKAIGQSLMKGNILYNPSLISEDINRNLKWGSSGEQKIAMQAYLSQIMTSIAFTLAKEGVGKIKWRFSYPSSLSASNRRKFIEDTKKIVNDLNSSDGLNSSWDEEKTYYTESIVAAQYHKANHDYLCIDIGGGSTDVSLWRGSAKSSDQVENILQFSIGMASRKIFTEAMANLVINCNKVDDEDRKKLQDKIISIGLKDGLEYDRIINNTSKKISPNGQHTMLGVDEISKIMAEFGREIEPIIHNNGDDIMSYIFDEDCCSEELRNSFYKYILVGFWGIMYYIVLSLKESKDELADVSHLKVCFAGNGSNVYSWLLEYFNGEISPKKVFEKALADLVKEEIGLDIGFEIPFEKDRLKTEAAVGLLRIGDEPESFAERTVKLVNGDKMLLKYSNNNTELSETTDLYTIPELSKFYNNESSEIKKVEVNYAQHTESVRRFVDNLNRSLFSKVDLKLDIDKEISVDKMKFILDNAIANNCSNGTLAPAFILELEALLSIIAGY